MERKRHLLVDTQEFALKVVISAADVQDRDGERLVAQALCLTSAQRCHGRSECGLMWGTAAQS